LTFDFPFFSSEGTGAVYQTNNQAVIAQPGHPSVNVYRV